jgi:hypothetical protein
MPLLRKFLLLDISEVACLLSNVWLCFSVLEIKIILVFLADLENTF